MADVTAQDEPQKTAAASADEKANLPADSQGNPPPVPSPSVKSMQAETSKVALSGEVAFNDSITVYSGNRIPHYDRGPVKAYIAKGVDKAPSYLFALVCEDQLSPRTTKASNYAAIINPSLVRLTASGAMYWPPAGKEKYCFIYENTLGKPLMENDTRGGMGMKAETVMNAIIKPMIGVLADMRDKDLVHGNIRPSNMFDGGSRSVERVVLGECLSMPIGYQQPVLYEPIDRSMASPTAKGTGGPQDDIYAFGVSLALLLRHFDPMEGLTDEQIIEKKMEEGTYFALLNRDRFSGAILELLRGMLQDDENQRWTIDEVMQWLDGRRLSPKQAGRRSKANRPLNFVEGKYIRPELLAGALSKNITEAKQLIESGEVEQWLTRALEDKAALARYEAGLLLAEEGGRGNGYAERLVTRTAIALHPEGPIRYKNLSIMPDGIGAALTEAFIMRRDIQTYNDFFIAYFITQWIDAQSGAVADVSGLVSRFDTARAYLRQKGFGGGMEKVLYSLNPEMHCLSEKMEKYHVRSPEDMMFTFEKIAKLPNRPAMFFDRHSIAFLSIKDRKNVDPYINDLNAPETYRRILAEMKILATVQKRSQMEKFPGIASWMADNLEPVYERFHDRELREDMKKKVDKMKDAGDLAKIVVLFDTPSVYQEDNVNFRRAMRNFYDLEQEMADIDREMKDESLYGQDSGRQIAAVVAGVLAAIIILASAFMAFHGSGKGF